MYEYIQSIEEKKLTIQLTWSAIDKKNNKKQNRSMHYKCQMSSQVSYINSGSYQSGKGIRTTGQVIMISYECSGCALLLSLKFILVVVECVVNERTIAMVAKEPTNEQTNRNKLTHVITIRPGEGSNWNSVHGIVIANDIP